MSQSPEAAALRFLKNRLDEDERLLKPLFDALKENFDLAARREHLQSNVANLEAKVIAANEAVESAGKEGMAIIVSAQKKLDEAEVSLARAKEIEDGARKRAEDTLTKSRTTLEQLQKEIKEAGARRDSLLSEVEALLSKFK